MAGICSPKPMDTKAIQAMIDASLQDAGSEAEMRDFLAAVADRRGANAGSEALGRGARFVIGYIEQVPYMMKVAWTAACNVGLEPEMEQILQMVESYWIESDDVIPDDLGAIGLLDDAYCSLTSLQSVSDHYRMQTGKHLFPNDLGAANEAIRRIIGEPYATELDRIVIRTMKETGVIEAVTAMASEEKRLYLEANSTIWSHGSASGLDVSELEALGLLDD
jgi:uncharacterized membrane protein YkvA (DUF1232 family)